MYSVLVLGSEGQIGSALVEKLNEKGYRPIRYDIKLSPFQDLRSMENWSVLYDAIHQADFVHFLAFDIGGSLYMQRYQDTYEFISNNVKIMNNVFSALNKHIVPFTFASSQMSNMSYSSYGRLKALGEGYTNSLGGINTKFWNVYNVETDPEKTHVITDFLRMAKYDGEIEMRTDGMEERQFLHAYDAADALIKIQEKYTDIDRGKNIDITSFEWNSIIEVADICSDLYDSCVITPNDKQDVVQRNAKNEPDEYVLEFWKPRITLEEGIADINKRMFKEKRSRNR